MRHSERQYGLDTLDFTYCGLRPRHPASVCGIARHSSTIQSADDAINLLVDSSLKQKHGRSENEGIKNCIPQISRSYINRPWKNLPAPIKLDQVRPLFVSTTPLNTCCCVVIRPKTISSSDKRNPVSERGSSTWDSVCKVVVNVTWRRQKISQEIIIGWEMWRTRQKKAKKIAPGAMTARSTGASPSQGPPKRRGRNAGQ